VITRIRVRRELRDAGKTRCHCGGRLKIRVYFGTRAVAVDCRRCGIGQGW
jgi:hypothetical protein